MLQKSFPTYFFKCRSLLRITTLALDDDCLRRTTIFRWYRKFQRGNFSLEDAEKAGRSRMSVTEETVSAVKKMLYENRYIAYHQIGR